MSEYYETPIGFIDSPASVQKSTDELFYLTMGMVDFTVHDKTRNCANNYFLFGIEARFAKIFAAMMENGTIKKCNSHVLAFSYTAPITVLIHLCDRDPAREKEAMEKMQSFIKQFIAEYGCKETAV